MNVSLGNYINIYRINRAIFLMEHTDLTLTEIAGKVGIKDSQHFSKLFFQIIGMTPSNYRKMFLQRWRKTAGELLSSDTIDQYTEESVQALRDALAEAEELLAQDLSEDQQSLIDEAASALQTAADSLEEIDTDGNEPENPGDGNNPEDPDNGNKPGNPDDSTSGGSGNKPADPGQNASGADQNVPQTGDSSAAWLWAAWILTALAAVLIAVKNKKTAE